MTITFSAKQYSTTEKTLYITAFGQSDTFTLDDTLKTYTYTVSPSVDSGQVSFSASAKNQRFLVNNITVTVPGTPVAGNAVIDTLVNGLTYLATGLSTSVDPGYYYRVRAIDSSDQPGAWSTVGGPVKVAAPDYSTATWLGNSQIIMNSNSGWYSAGGSGNTAFHDADLGTFSTETSLTMGGQIQTYGDGDADGHVVLMNYSVYPSSSSASTWHSQELAWYDYANNNNWFGTSDGSSRPAVIDISTLAAGTYKLEVYFSQQTGANSWLYETYDPHNYVANFTIGATLSRTPTSLSGFSTVSGTASEAKSFSVTATHLNGNLTVTPPTGYEVSTTSATSGFGNSVTLPRDANNKVTAQTVYVRLKSSASAGTYNGNVTVSGGGTTQVTVALTGSVAAAVPEIDVEASHAFGTMTAGQSKTETVTVNNTGTGALSISGVTFSGTGNGYFSVSPTTATVAAGGSQNLSVTFAPTVSGSYSVTMNIANNDSDENPKGVTLTATVKPVALTLGAAAGASPGTVTLTVSGREGDATVNVRRYDSSTAADNDTAGTGGTQVTAANANGTFTDSGLDGCKTYYYKAWQTRNSQTSAATDVKSAKTALATPDVWSTADDGSITLNWPPVKGAVNYTVEIATDDTFAEGGSGGVSEGFDSGSSVPDGWNFSAGGVGGTYTTSGNYGLESPSWQIKANATWTTPTFSGPTEVSFWYKGNGGTTSTLEIQQLVSGSWSSIETVNVPSTGTTYSHSLNAAATQLKFIFTKNAGNLALDDVTVTCSSGGGTMMAGYPVTVAQVAAGVTNVSHALGGLTNGVTYSYRVTANGAESCETTSSIGHEEPTAATPTMGVTVGGNAVSYDGTVAFGNVGVGSPQTKTFTVANTGSGTLTLGSVGVTADRGFTVTGPADGSVAGSGSTTFTVTFTPTVAMIGAGQKSATVSFTHNDGNKTTPYRFTVTATATGGILAVDESAGGLAFGNTPLDSPKTATVTIRNTGNAALTVGSVSVTGTGFALVSAWSSQTIAAGGSTTVSVRFAPASAGDKTGTLTVTASGAASGSPATVSLTGKGLNETTGNIWIKPLTTGNLGTKTVGDTMGEYFLNFEIGQSSWNKSEVGIGPSTGTLWSDFNWADATYYEPGQDEGNKRVRRDLSGFQFTQVGQYNVIYAAKNAAADNSTVRCAGDWVNYTTWLPTDFGETYFTVEAVPNPTVTSATAGYETVALRWSLDAASHPVMIVRYTGATPTVTAPTPGEHYESGAPIGAGTVVYREWAGTSVDTAVAQGTTYTYVLYSVNNGYYSAGAQTTVTSSSVSTPSVTVTDAGSGTLTGGDSGVTYVVARNTTGTFNTNPTGSGPNQGGTLGTGANAATVVYRGTAAGFTDTTAVGCNTYYYKVWAKAEDENAWSAGSTVATVSMPTPAAPVLNALSDVTYQGFTASWNAVPGAVTYRMDIVKGGGSTTYTLVTGSGTVADGEYVITDASDVALMGAFGSSLYTADDSLAVDGTTGTVSSTVPATGVWVIENHGSYYTIKNKSSGKYVTYSGSSNAAYEGTSATDAAAKWTLSLSSGVLTATSVNVSGRMLQYNASNPRFACYSTSQRKLHLYKASGGATPVAGWTDKDVGSLMTESAGVVSVAVTGLEELTTYSVTVRAEGATAACKSADSNTESATTLENTSLTGVTISDADGAEGATAVAAGIVAAGQTVLVQGSKLVVANGTVNPVLTGVTFATTGTATGSDIGTVRVRVGTNPTYAGTETVLGTATYTGAGSYTVSGSQTLTKNTTYYVWIEAVTAAGAAGGNTVGVAALTKDSFTTTGARKNGSTVATGLQKIGNLSSLSVAALTGVANQGAALNVAFGRSLAVAESGVLIRWSDVGYSEIPAPGTAWTKETTVAAGTASPVEVSGLTACKTYYFKAWEVVGGAVAGTAKQASGTVSAPAAPTGLGHGTPGAHNASLTWSAAAGATGYVIDLWHYEGGSDGSGDGGEGIDGTYTEITSTADFTDEGYYVLVNSNNVAMNSTVANNKFQSSAVEISGTTLTDPPAEAVWQAIEYEDGTFALMNASTETIATANTNNTNVKLVSEGNMEYGSYWWVSCNGTTWQFLNDGGQQNRALFASSDVWGNYGINNTGKPYSMPRVFKRSGGSGASGTRVDDVIGGVVQAGSAVTVTASGATGVNVTGLTDGTTYGWDVKAQGTECTGGTSAQDSFTTAELLGAPVISTPLASDVEELSGRVTGTAGATLILKRYESEEAALAGTAAGLDGVDVSSKATETGTGTGVWDFTDDELDGCTTYYYRAWQRATVDGEAATSGGSNVASGQTGLAAPTVTAAGAGTQMTISWLAVPGATSYKVQLSDTEDVWTATAGGEGAAVLDEAFEGFTAAANTDVSSSLNTYTEEAGWTGSKVYCNDGSAKLGASAVGELVTPTLSAMPHGGKVYFDLKKYNTDTGNLKVEQSFDGGLTWTLLKSFTPTEDWQTGLQAAIPEGTTSFKLHFLTTTKRAYIDNVRVVPLSEVAEGTGRGLIYESTVTSAPWSRTVTDLEVGALYYYRVIVTGAEGCETSAGSSASTANAPMIEVVPTHYNFGTVTKNSGEHTADFVVWNTGNEPLKFSAVTLVQDGTAYSITAPTSGLTADLAAGQSRTYTVKFNPQTAGPQTATLRFVNDAYNVTGVVPPASGTPTYGNTDIPLSGSCFDPATADPEVLRLEVTDGLGVTNTVWDDSLANSASQPVLSVLAYHFNGIDWDSSHQSRATWTLYNPAGTAVLSGRSFTAMEAVEHDGRSCVRLSAPIPELGAANTALGTWSVGVTLKASNLTESVTTRVCMPAETGRLLDDFTRPDASGAVEGALGNGWTAMASDGEPGSAAIRGAALEL